MTVSSTGTVTAGAITASGSAGNGTNQAGGNGGSILLDAGGAVPQVVIGGDVSAIGGNRTGTAVAGAGGSITIADTLSMAAGNRTITSRGQYRRGRRRKHQPGWPAPR
ncbi:hypothetical protein H1235_03215 [Pseudoxanthomonas sp. NC8]|nr:hypothetical protein H1235_03215 [Pseudoxanthomonas sp. NC8]